MRRFFYAVDNEADSKTDTSSSYPKLSTLTLGSHVELPANITHHWCRVLRAKIGDRGILFDGFGGEYQVQLQTISKKNATATLIAFIDVDRTAAMMTKVALVMSRGERMDYAIQKSTELGVTAIQLLSSQHGEVNLKPAQVEKKILHWQQVAIAACEQCGLNRLPLILAPQSMSQYLDHQSISKQIDYAKHLAGIDKTVVDPIVATLSQDPYYHKLQDSPDLQLIMTVPKNDQLVISDYLRAALSKSEPLIELLVGPEGGFSEDEASQAESLSFRPWQLGSRILRTETAPVVALATLQALRA